MFENFEKFINNFCGMKRRSLAVAFLAARSALVGLGLPWAYWLEFPSRHCLAARAFFKSFFAQFFTAKFEPKKHEKNINLQTYVKSFFRKFNFLVVKSLKK